MHVRRSFLFLAQGFHFHRSIATLLIAATLPPSLMTLRGQTLLLKDYTTRDGLPDSRVAPILQDRRGYIWFGTQAGLTRYDGREFTNFGPAREIPGIFGRSILEDHTGALWLAYSGFSRGGITRIREPLTIDCTNGLSGKQVTQVAEDRRSNFWVATSAGLEHVVFAAFDVASGKVSGRHYKRWRRIEFLDFMNRIVAEHRGREIHVILDNLNTHKPKNDRWLKRHTNVHFHFTPTKASWLNQVEIWFSILAGKALSGASFGSVAELKAHIEAFIGSYNETAKPFVWQKSEVHQKRLKPRFADQ